jgi:hypothetical protein
MHHVASRVFLSPREHRTEISLSVGDMGVQRLRIARQKTSKVSIQLQKSKLFQNASKQNSFDDLLEEESLFYGSGTNAVIDTEVLFAIGQTKEPEVDELTSSRTSNESTPTKTDPLLQLFYRRLAPRTNIFHEIKASFLPISIVYDEDALEGLSNLFDTESAFFDEVILNG